MKNIFRYSIGAFFALFGIVAIISQESKYLPVSILFVLFGISLMPFLYEKYLYNTNINKIHILLPILIFIAITIVIPREELIEVNDKRKEELKITKQDNENQENDISQKSEIQKKSSNKEKEMTKGNEKRKYKVCTDEYFKYIDSLKNNIINESDIYDSGIIRQRMPYLIVSLYTSKYIDEKKVDNEDNIIKEKFFNELTKNEYVSKCGLKASFEYINLEFNSYQGVNSNRATYKTYEQYYLLDINKYNNYDDFKNNK